MSIHIYNFFYVLEWPMHQILLGHKGKVNCLVYPHGVHPRYDPAYLVSGGRDFSVILWDIVKCDLLHRFCVQVRILGRAN